MGANRRQNIADKNKKQSTCEKVSCYKEESNQNDPSDDGDTVVSTKKSTFSEMFMYSSDDDESHDSDVEEKNEPSDIRERFDIKKTDIPEEKMNSHTNDLNTLASDKNVQVNPMPKSIPNQKNSTKNKKNNKKKDDDDFDALLLEFGIKNPTESESKQTSKKKGLEKPSVVFKEVLSHDSNLENNQVNADTNQTVITSEQEPDILNDDDPDLNVNSDKKDSNVPKSKKKKKKKTTTNETDVDTTKATKRPQTSMAAILAQKHLQKMEEERKKQEDILKEQEEQQRLLEAKEKAEQERLAAEKEKKKMLRKLNKEKLRQQGKLLSAKEHEKARKNEIIREQWLSILNNNKTENSTTKPQNKKNKIISSKKKKKKNDEDKVAISGENNCTMEIASNGEDVVEDTVILKPVESKLDESWECIVNWETDDDRVEPDNNSSCKLFSSDDKASERIGNVDNAVDKCYTPGVDKKKKVTPELKSPICCILGHVDTGKTKLLDKIRATNIQGGEAGGITQQIGATFFPKSTLIDNVKKLDKDFQVDVPGLLIIDTPGHESFNNLRARGSSLCDIAILVIDIMHCLEPQTLESIELLKARQCPFIVALNKIDRLFNWKMTSWNTSKDSLLSQCQSTIDEFWNRFNEVQVSLSELSFNSTIWWECKDFRKNVCIVPTSAMTGEGIPDLLYLLIRLTQSIITKSLIQKDTFQCTILEVKNIEGLGTTIDVILVAGVLYENDKIIVCGMQGPIITTIRALLTPQPLKELRVKGEYIHCKSIKASMGVKIAANNLEEAVAGTSILVARDASEKEIEKMASDVMVDMNSILKKIDSSGVGVYAVASTLGSLEAMLQFFETSKIPVFAMNIGTVYKHDIIRASVMREKGFPQYCCVLAFDVKVDPDALKEAQLLNVKIFTADIIYHIFDLFKNYYAETTELKKKEKKNEAVFPCILSIYPNYIFNKKDPIVLGVKVEEGIVLVGTPLCIPEKDKLFIGRITSLEHNKKSVEKAKTGDEVAIKIVGDSSLMFGRHFDHTNKLYSRITRESIDCLKEYFRDELKKDDWKLIVKLKKIMDIP